MKGKEGGKVRERGRNERKEEGEKEEEGVMDKRRGERERGRKGESEGVKIKYFDSKESSLCGHRTNPGARDTFWTHA